MAVAMAVHSAVAPGSGLRGRVFSSGNPRLGATQAVSFSSLAASSSASPSSGILPIREHINSAGAVTPRRAVSSSPVTYTGRRFLKGTFLLPSYDSCCFFSPRVEKVKKKNVVSFCGDVSSVGMEP